ncbi:hypothetical protein MFIFM68171_09054 [Madurella fahalii]|uniref:Uncharacterized protein n=1 Tax=Madurella fahalii TaxID=1157608 RepID=A0ABQ0GM59_9PEZI
MGSPREVVIPRPFGWLLPALGPVAGVSIYASIYVFGVGTIPFILAVVAGGLHFLLGLYFCLTRSRPGSYHMYTVPVWLVVCAGVWGGVLYYFTQFVELIVNTSETFFEGTDRPLVPVWSKVGCALSGLNVFLDLTLLGIFILSLVRQSTQEPQHNSYVSAPVYATSHVTEQSMSRRQQQQHQQQQQQPQPPQQQQQQQPQYRPYQYQYPQHQVMPATHAMQTPDLKSPSPSPSRPPSRRAYSPLNRIDVIRRLCALQHPDGHWDYSPELAELVKLWGGRELMAPAHGVTALTHACLTDLCNYVWTAQREGREHECLGSEELISLQGIHWDLGWAKNALDRAEFWLGIGIGY